MVRKVGGPPAGHNPLYVVRHEFSNAQDSGPLREARSAILLRSLDEPSHLTRFDTFASEQTARRAGGEAFQLLFEVTGLWAAPPTYAVFAEWQIAAPAFHHAFERGRKDLFDLRRRVLSTFASDWLLKRLDYEGRYLVLGLYGDEDGARRLCREHPEIQRFAAAHPATKYKAKDLTGLLCFRVEDLGREAWNRESRSSL